MGQRLTAPGPQRPERGSWVFWGEEPKGGREGPRRSGAAGPSREDRASPAPRSSPLAELGLARLAAPLPAAPRTAPPGPPHADLQTQLPSYPPGAGALQGRALEKTLDCVLVPLTAPSPQPINPDPHPSFSF